MSGIHAVFATATADGIHYGLQDLVVSPEVAPFAQGYWTAA